MAKRRLEVEIVGDTRSLDRALGRSEKKMGKFGVVSKRTGLLAARGFAAGVPAAGALGAGMVKLASDAEETASKFKIVFGKEAKRAEKNLNDFSKAVGTSRFELKEQAAQFQALIRPMGLTSQNASKMSQGMTKLATDLASFNNTSVKEAQEALQSGLVGEAEPLRRYGVQLSEVRVKSFAYAQGIAKVGATLTTAEKAQARYGIILRDTKLAQGDAERTAGSTANQFKRLQANVKDLGTELGIRLIPAANGAVRALNSLFGSGGPGQRSGFATKLKHEVRNAYFQINNDLKAAGRSFGDFKRVASDASRAVVSVFRNFTLPGFRRVFAGLRQVWSGFAQTVRGTVKVIASILRGDLGGVMRGMRSIVAGGVRGSLGVIRAFTAPFRQAAVTIGKNVVGGVVSGIGNLAGKLVEAGKSLGRTLLNAAKDFLGISSPSKEFMKVGGQVVSGFAKGLSAGNVMGVVKKHFGGMTKFATELVTGGALKLAKLPLSALSKIGGLFGGSKIQGGIQGGALVGIGRRLQQMGFQVGEHPAFGGVQGRHVAGSYHGRGRAIDVNWPNKAEEPAKLDQIKAMLRRVPHQELLWRAPGHMPGSNAHLHLAMRRGGMVPGSGSGDKVPVMAEAGEGFLNKRAVAAMGGKSAIDALNAMVPRFQSGGVVSDIARWAKKAGFKEGHGLKTAIAVALAESGGNTRAHGDRSLGGSHGLWQIHKPSHENWYRYGIKKLYDPVYNAKAAFAISSSGSNWRPWTTYNTGAYKQYMGAAGEAIRANRGGGNGSSGGGATGGSTRARARVRWRKTLKKARRYERGTAGRTSIADDAWVPVGEAAMAQAALTPSWTDDISAARLVTTIASNRYLRAVQSGDPKRIAETAGALGSAREGLFTATAAPGAAMKAEQDRQWEVLKEWAAAAEQAKEAARASKEAADAMATEMRLNRQLAERINSTSNAVAWKALADIMSGQIGNTVSQRAVSAGDGRMARF